MSLTRRTAWQLYSEPITSKTPFDPSKIDRIVLHYPGADWADMDVDNDGDFDKLDTVLVLRNTQHYYLTSRGFSLGYSFGTDDLGNEFEIRGFDYECAANVEVNDKAVAILAIVDEQKPASPVQVCAVQRTVHRIRTRIGKELMIVSHESQAANSTNTICPGSGLLGQLAAGAFEPPKKGDRPTIKFGQRNATVAYAREVLRTSGSMGGVGFSAKYDEPMAQAVEAWKRYLGFTKPNGKVLGERFWSKVIDRLALS